MVISVTYLRSMIRPKIIPNLIFRSSRASATDGHPALSILTPSCQDRKASTTASITNQGEDIPANYSVRLPRSVQSAYLQPLRREAPHGIPSCDLQLRSYHARNLEFFADFALRAAYFLGLPAFGPVPLPKKVERWTLTRSNFVHKKSQENFERITLRRLIQIKDGNPEVVEAWLAYLRKHAYYGVGMKANLWEYTSLDTASALDKHSPSRTTAIKQFWSNVGQKPSDAAKPLNLTAFIEKGSTDRVNSPYKINLHRLASEEEESIEDNEEEPRTS